MFYVFVCFHVTLALSVGYIRVAASGVINISNRPKDFWGDPIGSQSIDW